MGKNPIKKDDDWGYPYFRKPPYENAGFTDQTGELIEANGPRCNATGKDKSAMGDLPQLTLLLRSKVPSVSLMSLSLTKIHKRSTIIGVAKRSHLVNMKYIKIHPKYP